jgi:hypothetical protein
LPFLASKSVGMLTVGCPGMRAVALQDSLSDWATALLFDKAVEAAKAKPSGRKGAAASQAAAAGADDMDWQDDTSAAGPNGSGDSSAAAAVFHELRPLLAAVSAVGSAAGACLGKLCAAMGAKKKLKAAAVAKGLEALIAGKWPSLTCLGIVRACTDTRQGRRKLSLGGMPITVSLPCQYFRRCALPVFLSLVSQALTTYTTTGRVAAACRLPSWQRSCAWCLDSAARGCRPGPGSAQLAVPAGALDSRQAARSRARARTWCRRGRGDRRGCIAAAGDFPHDSRVP